MHLATIARAYYDTGEWPECDGGECVHSDGEYDAVFDVQWETCKTQYTSPLIDEYAHKYAYEKNMGTAGKYEEQEAMYIRFIAVYQSAVDRIRKAKNAKS